MRRRTQRVRREKPNYYDALEYDKQLKKVQNVSLIMYGFQNDFVVD